jgi:hypothetical protein
MKTYLFTWNPEKWSWKDLALRANESAAGKIVFEPWSCSANYTKIKQGDRAFLVKLGRKKPNGIIASGWVKTNPKSDLHWNPEKAALGEETYFADCEWERLLNPEIDEPLLLTELKKGKLASMHWTPQSSGVRIPDEMIDELEAKWATHVGRTPLAIVASDAELAAVEGAVRLSLVRHRKREYTLREAKISEARKLGNGRLKCEVPRCCFDFASVYGELGRDYAQVHHLKPIGDRTTPSETKLSDLAVVCANCHAMIHRGGKCRSLDNLIP